MNVQIPSIIILSGKPQSGKSYLIKYFMYEQRNVFDYGIVLTKTKFNDGYNYISSKYIHPDYDEKAIKALMSLQANLLNKVLKKVRLLFLMIVYHQSILVKYLLTS